MKFTKISEKQFEEDFTEKYIYDIKYEDIKLPQRATKCSAGYDFYAPYDIVMFPGCLAKIPTGIRANLDEDKVLVIVPRSGLGFKYGLRLCNTVGVIDADYSGSDNEGHIWVELHYPTYLNDKKLVIHKGEAMCQGIILPYFKVEDDNVDTIRNGGQGSTTKQN